MLGFATHFWFIIYINDLPEFCKELYMKLYTVFQKKTPIILLAIS